MIMERQKIASFQETVRTFYQEHGRHDLPWRQAEADGSFDPYKILVSEIMLQQTQVARVIPKYLAFLSKFPNVEELAQAKPGNVLAAWNGLGYNRRARFLWQTAQRVSQEFGGAFPNNLKQLITLPGVGPNTAGAIMAYAFNEPAVFIETNIRTVFIHHFFKDQANIPDKVILELVNKTLDREQPRCWYWSLMDYGSYLKQTVGNLNQYSKSYTKQSKFEGSRRQLRGRIIKLLIGQTMTLHQLNAVVDDARLGGVLEDLVREGIIQKSGNQYVLSES
jgi:A/G-specific adenine glycosylase